MLTLRPNVNPPALTTGVGPHGQNTVYIQPPEGVSDETSVSNGDDSDDNNIAVCHQQYHTLLDALNHAPREVAPIKRLLSPPSSQSTNDRENAPPATPRNTASLSTNDKENAPPATPRNAALSLAKALLDKARSSI